MTDPWPIQCRCVYLFRINDEGPSAACVTPEKPANEIDEWLRRFYADRALLVNSEDETETVEGVRDEFRLDEAPAKRETNSEGK